MNTDKTERKNLRICFLGDSMTYGVGTTKKYQDIIAELTGAEVFGFGIDGAKTIHLFTELENMEKTVGTDFDVLSILIGTNDFCGSVPIGEFFTEHEENIVVSTDENGEPNGYAIRKKREFIFTDDTFCGRLNKIFAYVKERYADKRIILVTPPHRAYAYFGLDNVQPSELYANSAGEYFEKYVETERKAADIWSVELVDVYRDSGLFPLADANAKLYFHDDKTDRLHPGAKGDELIAKTIIRKLGSI